MSPIRSGWQHLREMLRRGQEPEWRAHARAIDILAEDDAEDDPVRPVEHPPQRDISATPAPRTRNTRYY